MGLRRRAARLHADLATVPGSDMTRLGRAVWQATDDALEVVRSLDEALEALPANPPNGGGGTA
jgi:hypothetical protein